MIKTIAALAAAPLLVVGLAACGGDDEPSTEQTTASAPPAQTTAPQSPAADGTSAVDDYCRQVDEYAEAAADVLADPASGDTGQLLEKAEELQATATRLTQELINDPSQAQRVQECTTRLQEALAR